MIDVLVLKDDILDVVVLDNIPRDPISDEQLILERSRCWRIECLGGEFFVRLVEVMDR